MIYICPVAPVRVSNVGFSLHRCVANQFLTVIKLAWGEKHGLSVGSSLGFFWEDITPMVFEREDLERFDRPPLTVNKIVREKPIQ